MEPRSFASEQTAASLHLLANLFAIRDNLQVVGQERTVDRINHTLTLLQEERAGAWRVIDCVTALISWVYRCTPRRWRPEIFRGYSSARSPTLDGVYIPKAEVRHFCETIEPLILDSYGWGD